mmetsp:Transcript_11354/g.35100  ORF Transcript_11354/g.35100 Transcript_11354/m.35100 type:complete len:209 (-) Transcript_11354:195-821(-)
MSKGSPTIALARSSPSFGILPPPKRASPSHGSHQGPPPTSQAQLFDFASTIGEPPTRRPPASSAQMRSETAPSNVSRHIGTNPRVVGARSVEPFASAVAMISISCVSERPLKCHLPHGATIQRTLAAWGCHSRNSPPGMCTPIMATSSAAPPGTSGNARRPPPAVSVRPASASDAPSSSAPFPSAQPALHCAQNHRSGNVSPPQFFSA